MLCTVAVLIQMTITRNLLFSVFRSDFEKFTEIFSQVNTFYITALHHYSGRFLAIFSANTADEYVSCAVQKEGHSVFVTICIVFSVCSFQCLHCHEPPGVFHCVLSTAYCVRICMDYIA